MNPTDFVEAVDTLMGNKKGKKVCLSLPRDNPAQVAGSDAITEIVRGLGIEFFSPTTLSNMGDEGWIGNAGLVVGWADGDHVPGVATAMVANPTDVLDLPFPPDLQRIIDAGFHSLGGAVVGPEDRKVILLPGAVEKVKNSPKSATIKLPPGVFVAAMCPINIPSPTVMMELGVAIAMGIRVILLAQFDPILGSYADGNVETVKTIEDLSKALSEWKEDKKE